MGQKLIFITDVDQARREIAGVVQRQEQLFAVADTNTASIAERLLPQACGIIIEAGEENKNLATLQSVWDALERNGATRSSVVVNVGGGVVTDLGGFAAATFKRGVRFVNVPTTVLAAVDAAVGGKTGINYAGLKNEVGAFALAEAVVVCPEFFRSLPEREIYCGVAEMLKHALLDSEPQLSRLLAYNAATTDDAAFLEMIRASVGVKERIVQLDPKEQGLRKALNLGHTVAHAIESLTAGAVAHGHAVAVGLVTDLVLSHMKFGFPAETMRKVSAYVKEHYPALPFGCAQVEALIGFMRHDKKNSSADRINFTLLQGVGRIETDCIVGAADVEVALDLTCDLLE